VYNGPIAKVKCYNVSMQPGFLFGAGTSAHQVEGNNVHNDWWAWERSRNDIDHSGLAADHYRRYREDLQLAKELGHNAHRISLEWSRIEPDPGKFELKAIAHYRDVLLEMKRLGMTSFVTLHHFTNPLWLAERGGWEKRSTVEHFGRYVTAVAHHLGDLVDFWVTINEPMVYATEAYVHRRWPPQKKSWVAMWRVMRHMAAAHRRAYRIIHMIIPQARVGIAKHTIAFLPAKRQLDDTVIAQAQDTWFNHYFLSLTRSAHDFLGVNFYFTSQKTVNIFPPKIENMQWDGPQSDIGWPVRPEGLKHVLLHARRYGVPIYVTENGLADARDALRADFIRGHLRAIEDAQAEGADVRGYLHWSLLDNFEWDMGFGPRFGLVEVDYETQERRPRASAYVYKSIIERAQASVGGNGSYQ